MIDQSKLKEFQDDLNEKGTGPSIFINASKIDGSMDFRILDPLPNMDGLYALEVRSWWIGKVKVNVPFLFGGIDQVQLCIDDAKAAKNPELDKLLDLRDDFGNVKLRLQTEYWIPGLVFDWDLEGDDIIGIWNNDDTLDVEAISKFVRDDEGKILSCKIQLMKDINRQATTRGGSMMFDKDKGFNLILGKTGEKRKTVYSASKADVLPMPAKYYGEGTPDIVNICKASMFTDDYIYRLMGEYLYGEALADRTDDDYLFPEIRATLKKDSAEPEEKKPTRPTRAGVSKPAAEQTAAQESKDETAAEPETKAPTRPSSSARPATKEDVAANTTATPTRGGKGTGIRRNMTDDMKDV